MGRVGQTASFGVWSSSQGRVATKDGSRGFQPTVMPQRDSPVASRRRNRGSTRTFHPSTPQFGNSGVATRHKLCHCVIRGLKPTATIRCRYATRASLPGSYPSVSTGSFTIAPPLSADWCAQRPDAGPVGATASRSGTDRGPRPAPWRTRARGADGCRRGRCLA